MSELDLERTPWALAEGERDGEPLLLRVREGLEALVGDARWPRHLAISWRYHDRGMPSPEQLERMHVFEDAAVAALERDGTALLTFVWTCAGRRVWHFYFAEAQAVQRRLAETLTGPRLPLELEARDDADWRQYRDVLAGLDG